MIMKKLVGLLFSGLLFANTAFAQIVTVNGVGVDKDSAVRDAMRNAVENVVGTFISSETLVSQATVVEDEIYAKANGFVKNVKIIDENKINDSYNIRALIDVDTNPDSELRDKIQMIMLLGDPRIGVVVTYYNDADNNKREKYPIICEAAMNNKLTNLGFSHIVSTAQIFNDKNINRWAASEPRNLLPNNNIDYLIIGKLDLHTDNISLPSYSEMTQENNAFYNTSLITSMAEMDIEVLNANTGEVVNSYRVEGKAIQNNQNNAENAAVKNIGIEAAQKLKSVFAKKAAKVNDSMQIVIKTDSYDVVSDLKKSLDKLAGVNNVAIKSFANGKGIISIDTDLKPQTIFRMLREESSLDLSVQKYALNQLEITLK